MAKNRAWQAYPSSYRTREMQILADWITAGESGSVVGVAGSGRSNLLGFLCYRPDILQQYLPPQTSSVAAIPVDLNNLPTRSISALYRTILHAFYWVRNHFEPSLQQAITQLYLENRETQDPFLVQRVLYDLLLLFQERRMQVVLVLNRFDRFCQTATPPMLSTLRGLRDSFKDTLCYIVGMTREGVYLPDPTALGEMYELLDSHICWIGAMTETDARLMLDSVLRQTTPSEAEVTAMLALSGRLPVLLKAVGHWWLLSSQRPSNIEDWAETLLQESNIHYRLHKIWQGLTQEEQLALSEVQKLQTHLTKNSENNVAGFPNIKRVAQPLTQAQQYTLDRLAAKGLCYQSDSGWQINGVLLLAYVAKIEGRVRGRIWLDEKTRIVYQGQTHIEDLTSLQYEILRFFVKNPYAKHTRDDIIDNTWPEEDQRDGITPNALQVHIASIRKKIEPNPAQPRYFITWHGRPGGYQFFPEGRPE